MHDSLYPLTFFSPSHPHTSPPPTTYTNFTVTNASVLPENISQALKSLDQELKEGDLTERGYLKRKFHLLEPFKHLLVVTGNKSNAHTAATATTRQHSVEGGGGRGDSVKRGGWGGGGERQARNTANGKSYLYCLSSQLHTHLAIPLQAIGDRHMWNYLRLCSRMAWGGED